MVTHAGVTEQERLRSIILPILAKYSAQFRHEFKTTLDQKFSILDETTRKKVDEVRRDLIIPVSEPANPTTHIGTQAPNRAFGENGELFYTVDLATTTVLEIYKKDNGVWTLQATFPVTAVTGPLVTSVLDAHLGSNHWRREDKIAEFQADGVLTSFDVPEGAYIAGTGKLYYRGRRYGTAEFTETATGFTFQPYGNPPKQDTSTAEAELIYDYQTLS